MMASDATPKQFADMLNKSAVELGHQRRLAAAAADRAATAENERDVLLERVAEMEGVMNQ